MERIDSMLLDQHASVHERKAAGRACGAVKFVRWHRGVCNLRMVTCLLCLLNGGVVSFCVKGFIWYCRPIPGVVGFSFSGICPLESCLKLLRADCQGPEEW